MRTIRRSAPSEGARRAGLSGPAGSGAAKYARDHFRHARPTWIRAFAAGRHGVPAVIYVPKGNSVEKNRAMRRDRRRTGRAWRGLSGGRRRMPLNRAAPSSPTGLHSMVPSFHPDLVPASRPTRSNCLRAAPDLDVASCADRAGPPATAAASWRGDLLGLKTEIVGVQSTEAPSYAGCSLRVGTVVTTRIDNQQHAGRRHGHLDMRSRSSKRSRSFARAPRASCRSRTTKIAAAVRAYWTDTHNLAEGAGAAARWSRRCRKRQPSPRASASA